MQFRGSGESGGLNREQFGGSGQSGVDVRMTEVWGFRKIWGRCGEDSEV